MTKPCKGLFIRVDDYSTCQLCKQSNAYHTNPEFFDKAWDGMSVPADLRRAVERIVSSYGIRGICDPGYIANVIARETGRGDGLGSFEAHS